MPEDTAEDERLQAFVTELTVDPRKGKGVVARWTKAVGPGEAVAFFEEACRNLAAGHDDDAAAVCFGHVLHLDPVVDDAGLDRLHARFLNFAPLRAIAPKDYRAYANTLTAKTDPATAHSRFREVVCAALDSGFVPYAAFIPDLRGLARAAGIKRADEESFLAERMLRTGALAGASLKVWQGALPALERLAKRDDELLRLLTESEPEDGSDDPDVAQQIRDLWLELLAEVGAGRVLSANWFAGPGVQCPMEAMFALVRQADLPGWQPADGSVPDDGPQFSQARRFAPGEPDDTQYVPPRWDAGTGDGDLAGRLSAFIAQFGRFINVDYVDEIEKLWNLSGSVRPVLREQVAAWTADAASTGLHAMDAALRRLVGLAAADYQNIDSGFAASVTVTDPVVSLMTALRAGLPAELALPGAFSDPTKALPSMMHVTADGSRLTVFGGWVAHVMEPRQQTISFPVPVLPNGPDVTVWHDGRSPRLAWRVGDRRYSFLINGTDRDRRVTLDPDPAWPQTPTEAEVFFPGASAATRVSSVEGFVYVHAADGAPTIRIPYGGQQFFPSRNGPIVAPPAWWQHLDAVDVKGSEALRAVDETHVRRLLEAGFCGPRTVADVASEVLPDVTDPRLRAAVAEAAVTAARCATTAADLRRRLGLAQPAYVPELLRCRPDLPSFVSGASVVGARLLDEAVRGVLGEEPGPDGELRLVRTMEVPTGALGFWFSGNLLGGVALGIAWPWHPVLERKRELERLQAMANTPQADGSRRWRYRWLKCDRSFSPDPTGQLWRTPTSVLAALSNRPHKEVWMVEYAPDGVFDPRLPAAWTDVTEVVRMPGWGSPDQVASFVRLLEEKGRGPVPFDAAQAVLLAEKTGIGVGDAARACFGDRSGDSQPEEIRALYGSRDVDYRDIDGLRDRLMPDDPAELWTSGLDVEKAAAWWESRADG